MHLEAWLQTWSTPAFRGSERGVIPPPAQLEIEPIHLVSPSLPSMLHGKTVGILSICSPSCHPFRAFSLLHWQCCYFSYFSRLLPPLGIPPLSLSLPPPVYFRPHYSGVSAPCPPPPLPNKTVKKEITLECTADQTAEILRYLELIAQYFG